MPAIGRWDLIRQLKALIEENTYFLKIIEGYQEYFIIIHLYKQGSLFHKMSVRGPLVVRGPQFEKRCINRSVRVLSAFVFEICRH
jgi:hypothetical protein